VNNKVKALLASMREELDLASPPDERVVVDRKELDALVTYMEVRLAEDELEAQEIVVGDRVKSLVEAPTIFGGVPTGTVGTVYHIHPRETGRIFPFSVETDDGTKVAYQRHEITRLL